MDQDSLCARDPPRGECLSSVREARGERGIWQRRFWEHLIRDENDYARHVEYYYINPVKHGHVTRVADWPYSSFHRDVRAGLFPEDWAGDCGMSGEFGE
jgi:putative transposase